MLFEPYEVHNAYLTFKRSIQTNLLSNKVNTSLHRLEDYDQNVSRIRGLFLEAMHTRSTAFSIERVWERGGWP